jgi:hypothetical protein
MEAEIMSRNVSFAYDGGSLFFPTAPGRVFSISFNTLAASELLGGDELADHFAATVEITDLAGMLITTTTSADAMDVARDLTPICGTERQPPRPWVDAGGGDFEDSLGGWACWCETRSEQLDAEDAKEERDFDTVLISDPDSIATDAIPSNVCEDQAEE